LADFNCDRPKEGWILSFAYAKANEQPDEANQVERARSLCTVRYPMTSIEFLAAKINSGVRQGHP
jgi:hypothetical protein